MLVLCREFNEVIMIGDDVRITVVGITKGKVRLGIDAPKEIPVHRKEVYDVIKETQNGMSGKDAGMCTGPVPSADGRPTEESPRSNEGKGRSRLLSAFPDGTSAGITRAAREAKQAG